MISLGSKVFHARDIMLVACVAFASLLTAYASGSSAFANIASGSRPELAITQVFGVASAAGSLADRTLLNSPDAKGLSEAAKLAKASIDARPIDARSLRVLGMAADVQGRSKVALQLLNLSNRMSRRDIGTQIWLLENSIRRGDITDAMLRYDLVLRTSEAMWPNMFPILASALDSAEVRSALAPYVKASPVWMPPFLSFAVLTGHDPKSVARLIKQVGELPTGASYRVIESELLKRLAAEGEYEELKGVFGSLAGARSSVLHSAKVDVFSTNRRFEPISWHMSEQSGISAALESDASGRSLKIRAYSGSGQSGLVAEKLLFVPPGDYNFTSNSNSYAKSTNADAHWTIACLGPSGRTDIWKSANFGNSDLSVILQRVALPSNCAAYAVGLLMNGGDGQDGLEIGINAVDLKPISALD